MSDFLADARDVLVPGKSGKHGPLPPLLVSMTLVTGLVDAFSYLVLGHVFVANMTGNVVFLGFALAGAARVLDHGVPGRDGGVSGRRRVRGRLSARHRDDRGRLHSSAGFVQAAFLVVAVVLAVVGGSPPGGGYRYALITLLGLAMGVQNAAARAIAVPDLTTTVLTLTITGIAADSSLGGGKGSRAGRRLVPVVTMAVGALVGAALVLHAQPYDSLAIALAVTVAGAAVSQVLGKSNPEWVKQP